MSDRINGVQSERDEHGRFTKGNKAGGRLPVEREHRYYQIMMTHVTIADWEDIIKRAVTDAKRGDSVARKWLADYLIGTPVERKSITVEGNPLAVQLIEIVRHE